ncbi:oleate hydratase [Clostridium sp. CM028]|uniref:oleate hydratase n=1 Tax=Clostridium sp. CM028 TaxID=2851575 RepID=UPI001C6DF89B|nr:oleate hydratase [Clostridium sp. CM028]MBW9150590.1 oleate hydratase [Clostridium sp. CM028]WLC62528.1 oleate hydratase [Clostridium sp. CM028]
MEQNYKNINEFSNGDNYKIKAYLVGGGIASLASAVYFIRDGHVSGKNISIFEESNITGGSLDAQGSAENGYVYRGGRMFDEEAYTATFDLLSSIPSLTDSEKTLYDEFVEFNKKFKSSAKARLVGENKEVIDVSSLGFNQQNRLDLIKIMAQSEESLGTSRVKDCFGDSFFKSKFWFMWCTTFAFQPWHSAVEFKRYLHRFIHELPRINTLSGVRRTPYNQYDSMVLPIVKWLKEQGVHFEMNCEVTNLDFKTSENEKTVERIHYTSNGKPKSIHIENGDYVLATIGSMTAGSSLGSMSTVPKVEAKSLGGSWKLWENIAKNRPEFGKPSVFDDHIDESLWESFTVTFRDPTFFRLMESFNENSVFTFKDSNWLMSVVLPHQPYYNNQPENVNICWGYCLSPNKKGNYVQKKMSECTGEEILTELCCHLALKEEMPLILKTSTCIPCIMPFITSQFLPRTMGDRPAVVPIGSTNLAFIGQFCEMPDDVVFTVDYSVRSAQTAVYSLLKLDKEVTPIYKGQYDTRVVIDSAMTMLRDDNLRESLSSVLNIFKAPETK